MRAQLVHLTGPHRGHTETYPGPNTLIGTDPDAGACFRGDPAVAARHAEIAYVEEGCAFYLRRIQGRVFVNRREVDEVVLEDGDLLEFGVDGPRVRFRIQVAPGHVCKPVRLMMRDATDVGRASGAFAFTGSFVRDLLVHATWQLKVGVPLGVAAVLGLAFAAGWLGSGRDAFADEVESLRDQLAELRAAQSVSLREAAQLRDELAARSAALDALRAEDDAVARVHDVYARGVCLVYGEYGFRTPDAVGGTLLEDRGGAPLTIQYTGSGFRATEAGHVITNRHVVHPWEFDAEARPLLELGFEPVMLRLFVTFPDGPPLAVSHGTVRVRADNLDVAAMRLDLGDDVPVVPMADQPGDPLRGARVLVVGYPTGVNALLAKADEGVSRAVVDGDPGLFEVIHRLAASGAISPLVTSGTLGDVGTEKLVYDAPTTVGGSGGPVFDGSGRVIAVNFAIMREFSGSNFGVPIRFARELLP